MLAGASNTEAIIIGSLILGIGATVVMDIWAVLLKYCFNIPGLDYALVGRWIGHMRQGRFIHGGISKSAKVSSEAVLGWTAHYLIGIIFAFLLLQIWGLSWLNHPTLTPAVLVGLSTVVFPFFLMQPCFGMGVAANNLPNPNRARIKSLTNHFIFGIGLYVTAQLTAFF